MVRQARASLGLYHHHFAQHHSGSVTRRRCRRLVGRAFIALVNPERSASQQRLRPTDGDHVQRRGVANHTGTSAL
jgi:catechol-2,3-dioxygenase